MCSGLPAAAQSGPSSANTIDQAVANVNTRPFNSHSNQSQILQLATETADVSSYLEAMDITDDPWPDAYAYLGQTNGMFKFPITSGYNVSADDIYILVPEMALSIGRKRTSSALEDPNSTSQAITKMIKSASQTQKEKEDEEEKARTKFNDDNRKCAAFKTLLQQNPPFFQRYRRLLEICGNFSTRAFESVELLSTEVERLPRDCDSSVLAPHLDLFECTNDAVQHMAREMNDLMKTYLEYMQDGG